MTETALHPHTLWAQRKDKVFITMQVADFKSSNIDLKDDTLIVEGNGGVEQKPYKLELKFYAPVNSEGSQLKISSREVYFQIPKKMSGPYWPRLISEKVKPSFLKTDFNRWQDEDDSGNEDDNMMGGGGRNLEEMMAQMGGGGAGGAGGFPGMDDLNLNEESEDSDDEELPDLDDDTSDMKS